MRPAAKIAIMCAVGVAAIFIGVVAYIAYEKKWAHFEVIYYVMLNRVYQCGYNDAKGIANTNPECARFINGVITPLSKLPADEQARIIENIEKESRTK